MTTERTRRRFTPESKKDAVALVNSRVIRRVGRREQPAALEEVELELEATGEV